MRRFVVTGIVIGMMAAGLPALAETSAGPTKEELLMLFQKQKSRGLKLAPGTALPTETAQPSGATAAAQPSGATATAQPTGAATTVAAVSGTATAPVSAGSGTATAPVAGNGTAASTNVAAVEPSTVVVATPVTAAEVDRLPTVAEGAPVPVVYTELDQSEQVNIRIGFDFDSAVLRDSEKEKLVTLCAALQEIDGTFRIIGHTDATGTAAYNEKLSLLRAEEVKRHLVGDCGIQAERLEAVGVGKRFLYNEEDPQSEENRRVEFQALS